MIKEQLVYLRNFIGQAISLSFPNSSSNGMINPFPLSNTMNIGQGNNAFVPLFTALSQSSGNIENQISSIGVNNIPPTIQETSNGQNTETQQLLDEQNKQHMSLSDQKSDLQ